MKRILIFVLAILLVAFAATPAFAQDGRAGDRVCTGGSLVIKSDEVVNSVLLFGCGARIESGAQIRRDIVSSGGDVVIEEKAIVQGDVVLFGGNLTVAGEIREDVATFGGNITLESTAVVGGDLAPIGGNLDRKEGAVVRGKVSRGTSGITPPRAPTAPLSPTPFSSGWFGGVFGGIFNLVRIVLGIVALAALGALTIAFWPTQTKQIAEVAQGSALPSLGVGCLTWIAAPTLIVLLVITICGIPFGAFVGLALAVAMLVGWIALGRLAGEKILDALHARQASNAVIAGVVGVLVLALISAAPILGWLIGMVVSTMGLGAVVLTRFGTRAYPAPGPATAMPVPAIPPAPATPPTSETSDTNKVEA